MTDVRTPPGESECELSLIGPGYGECAVLHVGGGRWVIVDSSRLDDERPRALRYLESIDVNPVDAVALIVATHWHDDHIRGMAEQVRTCRSAAFCCSAALCQEEFLALASAPGDRFPSPTGSGLREISGVVSHLKSTGRMPIHALGNRIIYRHKGCTLRSLSPPDVAFQRFLQSVRALVPGEPKRGAAGPSPNEVSVALWVEAGKCVLLLGADLETAGWTAVLSGPRPDGRASVFKVPHHGSKNADKPEVWKELLEDQPVAVLTPWRRGRIRPTEQDARRILRATPEAWITNTNPAISARGRKRDRTRQMGLRDGTHRLQRIVQDEGMVRLRRRIESDDRWSVETFGPAGNLVDYAA